MTEKRKKIKKTERFHYKDNIRKLKKELAKAKEEIEELKGIINKVFDGKNTKAVSEYKSYKELEKQLAESLKFNEIFQSMVSKEQQEQAVQDIKDWRKERLNENGKK